LVENIELDLKEVRYVDMYCIKLSLDRGPVAKSFEGSTETSGSIKDR
jgi:hypothetical protein